MELDQQGNKINLAQEASPSWIRSQVHQGSYQVAAGPVIDGHQTLALTAHPVRNLGFNVTAQLLVNATT